MSLSNLADKVTNNPGKTFLAVGCINIGLFLGAVVVIAAAVKWVIS